MELKMNRTLVTYFYECGDKYFKVWGTDRTGWYVEQVTVHGEVVNTVAMVDNMADAEKFMKGQVMA